MINARGLAVSVLGAVLMVAPSTRSQGVRPLEGRMNIVQPLTMRVLDTRPWRTPDGWLQAAPVAAPAMAGLDLSRYRDFQFGETLPVIVKQVGLELSDVRMIHKRPAVVQQLEWPIWLVGGSPLPADPVKTILFSFCNGELFRIVVTYDRDATEGLTTEDMIQAISAKYGIATRLAGTEISFPSIFVDNDSETIVARWENPQYSFNLYRSNSPSIYGMIAFSKKADTLARAASVEALRLEAQDAPQREIRRQQNEDQKNREALEKARGVNKPNFRL